MDIIMRGSGRCVSVCMCVSVHSQPSKNCICLTNCGMHKSHASKPHTSYNVPGTSPTGAVTVPSRSRHGPWAPPMGYFPPYPFICPLVVTSFVFRKFILPTFMLSYIPACLQGPSLLDCFRNTRGVRVHPDGRVTSLVPSPEDRWKLVPNA